ncbi:protein POLR1D-like isoform X2 [Liolophura sinensis]
MEPTVKNGEVKAANNQADKKVGEEEEELERLAMEELIKEAKRGAERARDMGATGWLKAPIPRANKRFLNNTVVSTLRNLRSPVKKKPHQQTDGSHMDETRSAKSGERKSDLVWRKSRSSEHRHHHSTNDHTHPAGHRSEIPKSSKRHSDMSESLKRKKDHKSRRHERKHSHRKSKKRKEERLQ